jgi:hypothetical protein
MTDTNKAPQGQPRNPELENLDCLDARLIELELLEQALNDKRDMKWFVKWRLDDLQKRRANVESQPPATVAEGSEELLPIRRLGAQGSYNALREFARTLTTKARELEAQESSHRLGTGHAAGILQSMIENFVYAAIKTGVKQ